MQVRRAVLDAIRAHARRDSPRECCGLLLGTAIEITEAVGVANVADDPRRRYEIAPAEYLAQIRRCREAPGARGAGLTVLGGYHSHPHSGAAPSPTDLEQAFEEFLYVIAGPADGTAPIELRAYRFRGGRLEAVELILV